MSLTDQLHSDMKDAMRRGDAERRDTLRMVIAAVQNAEKDKRGPLTDEEALAAINREVKKRRESIGAYRDAGREDLALSEQAEVDILTPYLPQPFSEAQLRDLVAEAIASTGATSPQDMGRVMSALMPKVGGRADGKLVSSLVSQELAGRTRA